MRRNNAHIIPFFLLLLSMVPLLVAGLLQLHVWITRHQMEEKLEHQSLQEIAVLTRNIRWEKPGHELWYQGKMFDVKSLVQSGDTAYITGLFDEAETRIAHRLATLAANHPDSRQDTAVLTRIFYQLTWEAQVPGFVVPEYVGVPCKHVMVNSIDLPRDPFLGVNNPPPDLI